MTITSVHPPRATVVGQALRWITDRIIQCQPGAYTVPHPDGGQVWLSPFGSGKSPQILETGTGLIRTRQTVEVCSPSGDVSRYEVTVSISDVHEEGDERRATDDHDEAGRQLPAAAGPPVLEDDAEAAAAGEPQEQ